MTDRRSHERRTRAKLSNDSRASWQEIQATHASPTKASQRARFDRIRTTTGTSRAGGTRASASEGREVVL
jgi:hypothetical protein